MSIVLLSFSIRCLDPFQWPTCIAFSCPMSSSFGTHYASPVPLSHGKKKVEWRKRKRKKKRNKMGLAPTMTQIPHPHCPCSIAKKSLKKVIKPNKDKRKQRRNKTETTIKIESKMVNGHLNDTYSVVEKSEHNVTHSHTL